MRTYMYTTARVLSLVSDASRHRHDKSVQFRTTRCVPPSHSTLLLPGRISNPSALLLISLLPCASCKGTNPHSHFFGEDPLNTTPGSWTVPLRFRSWPIPPVVSPPSSSSSDPSIRGAPTVEPRRCRWRFMRHAERGLLGLAGIRGDPPAATLGLTGDPPPPPPPSPFPRRLNRPVENLLLIPGLCLTRILDAAAAIGDPLLIMVPAERA